MQLTFTLHSNTYTLAWNIRVTPSEQQQTPWMYIPLVHDVISMYGSSRAYIYRNATKKKNIVQIFIK